LTVPGTAPKENTGEVRGFVGPHGARVSYLTVDHPHSRPDAVILLIHGTGMSARTWTRQLHGLPPQLRVIAVDLPGHGESDSLAEVTVDQYAEAVDRLLDALAIRSVIAVGHSLGGGVAIALASRRARLVKGLLLVSSCAKLPQNYNAFEGVFRSLPAPIRRFVLFASAKRMLFPAGASAGAIQLGLEDLRACPPETVRRDTAAAKAMDLEGRARELRAPTRILCGTRDLLTPVALSHRLNELIAGSELHLVPGAGHMLPLESPDRVNQEIITFAHGVTEGGTIAPVVLVRGIKRALVGRWLDKVRGWLSSSTR